MTEKKKTPEILKFQYIFSMVKWPSLLKIWIIFFEDEQEYKNIDE